MKVISSPWLLVSGALLVGAQACVFDHVEECEERHTCSGGAPAVPVTASSTGAGGASAGGSGGANTGGADLGGGGAG